MNTVETLDSSVEKVLRQYEAIAAHYEPRVSHCREPDYSYCRTTVCRAAGRDTKIGCRCGENTHSPTAAAAAEGPIGAPGGGAWDWRCDVGTSGAASAVKFLPTHVLCHEGSSQGCAVLLGDRPLQPNWHHYFEVKILTDLHGTDTMVGVCTDQFNGSAVSNRFVDGLGLDSESWGYSHHGRLCHNGLHTETGAKFGKGSIVGVYVDGFARELRFYLNRQWLGVTYTNVGSCCEARNGVGGGGGSIYAAFCTTGVNTCVRLITAVSVPESLQLRSAQTMAVYMPILRYVLPQPITRLAEQFPWQHYPVRRGCERLLSLQAAAAAAGDATDSAVADYSSLISTPSPSLALRTTRNVSDGAQLPFTLTPGIRTGSPLCDAATASSQVSLCAPAVEGNRLSPTHAFKRPVSNGFDSSYADSPPSNGGCAKKTIGTCVASASGRGFVNSGRGILDNGCDMSDNRRGLLDNGRGMSDNGRGLCASGQGLLHNGSGSSSSRRGDGKNGHVVLDEGRGSKCPSRRRRLRVYVDSDKSDGEETEPVAATLANKENICLSRTVQCVGGDLPEPTTPLKPSTERQSSYSLRCRLNAIGNAPASVSNNAALSAVAKTTRATGRKSKAVTARCELKPCGEKGGANGDRRATARQCIRECKRTAVPSHTWCSVDSAAVRTEFSAAAAAAAPSPRPPPPRSVTEQQCPTRITGDRRTVDCRRSVAADTVGGGRSRTKLSRLQAEQSVDGVRDGEGGGHVGRGRCCAASQKRCYSLRAAVAAADSPSTSSACRYNSPALRAGHCRCVGRTSSSTSSSS